MVKGADSPEISKKREQEKATMETMVRIYCRGSRHKRTGELCPECEALLSYANSGRIVVLLWRPKHFAAPARFTAIRRKCRKKSGRSCAIPGRGCFLSIR